MLKMKQLWAACLAFLAMAMAAPAAMAQAAAGVDVSATTGRLGEIVPAVLAIGVAVLAIAVGIKLYKWVKQAL